MAAHHVAVVGCEDDDGFVYQAALLQGVQDGPHVGVHQAAQPPVPRNQAPPVPLRIERDPEPLLLVDVMEDAGLERLLPGGHVGEVGGQGHLSRIVLAVAGTEVRLVGLEDTDVEDEGPLFVLADEARSLAGEESRFAVLLGQTGAIPQAERLEPILFHLVRLESLVHQVLVVGAVAEGIPALGVDRAMLGVLDADPLVEPVLGIHIVPQVPFAVVGADVAAALDQLRQARSLRLERRIDVAGAHSAGVGIEPGEEGRARGLAHRL